MATSKRTPGGAPTSDKPGGQVTQADVDAVTEETSHRVETGSEGVTEVRYSDAGPTDQVPLPLLEPGDKPFPSAPPVLDREASDALRYTTGQPQVRADAPEGTDVPKRELCVVDACQWTRLPGKRICSAHEIHYLADGTPRSRIVVSPDEGNGARRQVTVLTTEAGGNKGNVAGQVASAEVLAHPKVVAPAAETGDLQEP